MQTICGFRYLTKEPPTFGEFVEFIRDWAGLSAKRVVLPETRFEDDLGITGDDGRELLEETERYFGVCLSTPEHGYRKAFNLGPNEFLFHSEGFWERTSEPALVTLFSYHGPPAFKALAVGELFEVVRRAY